MGKHNSKLYNRRLFLKSSGVCIALPFLHSLTSSRLLGSSGGIVSVANSASIPSAAAVAASKSASGIPKRLVFIPMGYGVNSENWFPSADQPGTDYDLPPLVQAFEDVKSDISFIQNLQCARIPDPHAGTVNFLTCSPGKERKDKNFKNTISCDQIAAELLGKETRFNHLSMGNVGRADGHGGFVSYGQDGKPVGVHRTMTELYKTLFGAGGKDKDVRRMLAREESSLDALLSDAKKLNRQVSVEDRDRIDEYFTSIRNIELKLAKAQEWADTPYPDAPFDYSQLQGRGKGNIELVFDMMITAMKTDSTRVLSYMIPTAAVLKKTNPHRMSHQGGGAYNPKAPTLHQERDKDFSELVAGFIKRLKETKEVDGSSLLDNTLLVYGSCLRQGHRVSDGPLILAGHGGGGLKQGQNIVLPHKTVPLANLWLSMIRHVGVPQDQFANSDGVIKEMGFL